MKVISYGGQVSDRSQFEKLKSSLSGLDGTCYVSDKKKKPNGVWRKCDKIDSAGVWFHKNKSGHTKTEIWKKVGDSDTVVLLEANADKVEHEPIRIHGENDVEVVADGIRISGGECGFYLSEEYHPKAYKSMMEDLIEGGMTVGEAKRRIAETPIDLEIYYEKGHGLFAVDCSVVERGDNIMSPYTGNMLEWE